MRTMQSSYGAPDVTGSRPLHQQLFPPPESFSLPPNFTIPNSSPSILDTDSQHLQHPLQVHLQHQFQLFRNHHQQQQPSVMMIDPLSKFRDGIGHQNGAVLPHNLLGLVSGNGDDHQSVNFDAAAAAKNPPLWRYDQNGMAEPQFEKFPEEQVFGTDCSTVNPNYSQLGGVYAPQAPEFENQTSGSAGEIHQQLDFPNVLHINRGDGGGGETELKNKHKCSSLESNTKEEEEDKNLERQLERMARAFEGRILAHQERLYERFMEKIDKLEKERIEREESWRAAESERARVQAAARAQELAFASSREAVIVSYLERITSEKILLPNSSSPSPPPPAGGGRWPKPEVEALVRVRSEIEATFREQGKKAALWEEVSSTMGRIGYQRSAKSFKEKWENINKYYAKKSKDEVDEEKKRAPKRRMKTCSYFDQLNQLYSRQDAMAAQPLQVIETDTDSKTNNVNDSSSSYIDNTRNVESKDGSEDQKGGAVENELLLEAMLDTTSNVDPRQSKSEETG